MASAAKAVCLTPCQVEELASEYRSLELKIYGIVKKALDDAAPHRKRLDEVWEVLLAQVRQFGSAHAEKSKLLHGLTLEVMATFGSSSSIDGAAVETFRLALVKAKQSRLLKRIFEKTIRWTLAPQASTLLRAEHDAGKLPNKLFMLFARCSVPKDLTPKLVVRPKPGVA
jgi:hypothetical protein